jgi:hypothetical protein
MIRRKKKHSSKARAKRLREKMFARAMTVMLKSGPGPKADKTLMILGKRIESLEKRYGLKTSLK